MPRSGNVDERIVEMRIDHKNFESGAKTTISTLEKLEKALKLKGASSGLNELEKSINKFDASSMTKGLEKVQMSFSALEVAGLRVISNLTDSLYRFTTRMAKSLTVDQVTAGWSKYEKMIESTQTIMAATANQVGEGLTWANQEEQMKDIQKYLDGLLWYTDETSYSFTDMTDNLGKFLSAGRDLETSYRAMMGIASWGATAGAKPAEVARAMYNISQAMGTGAMKAIDWRSIENANMATLDFKNNAIATAKELGKLYEVTNDVNEGMVGAGVEFNEAGYIIGSTDEQVENMMVTAENFRDSLQTGWLDSDVMEAVFEKYGRFAELLRQATSQNYGEAVVAAFDSEGNAIEGLSGTLLEATDMLQLLEEYRDSLADPDKAVEWDEWAKEAGTTTDNLQGLVRALDSVGIAYSETGFKMGQEAKTFTDALEATKDAVSSQWMKSFQYIFGDYMQAKEFWTDVTTELWDIFAAGGARRNQILKEWSRTADELGHTGRDYLLGKWSEQIGDQTIEVKGALWNLLDAIYTVTDPITEAFANVFGFDEDNIKNTGDMLRALTKRFHEFTQELGFSEGAQNGIRKAFTGVFTVLKTGLKVGAKAVQIFSRIAMVFGNILDGVISLVNGLADLIHGDVSFDEFTEQLQNFYKNVKDSAKNALLSLLPTEEKLLAFYEAIKNKYQEVKETFKTGFTWDNFKKLLPSFGGLSKKLQQIGDYLRENYSQIAEMFDNWKQNHSFLGDILDSVSGAFSNLDTFLQSIKINTDGIREAFSYLGTIISTIFGTVFGDPAELQQKATNFFSSIWNGLKDSVSEWQPSDYFKAIRTAGFTVLLVKIGSILSGFKKAQEEFTGIFPAITGVLKSTGKAIEMYGKQYQANAYIKMAIAVGILAASLLVLSKVPEDRLTDVAVSLAMLVGVLTLFASAVAKIFGKGSNNGNWLSGNKISFFNGFAQILVGFSMLLGAIAAILVIAKKADPLALLVIAGGLIGLLAIMGSIVKKLSEIEFKNSAGAIGSILAFSFAIQMLLPVIALLAIIPVEKTIASVFGVLGLFIGLGGLAAAMQRFVTNGANLKQVATSMLLMSLALDALLPVLLVCAALTGSGFGRGFAGLLGIMILLGAMTVIMSKIKINGKNFIMLAAGMAVLGVAINLLVLPLTALSAAVSGLMYAVNWKQLIADLGGFWKALGKLVALAGVAVAFSIAIAVAGAGVMLFGVGLLFAAAGAGALTLVLVPLATSITAFVNAINGIQGIDVKKLLLIAGAFTVMGLAIAGTLLLVNKLLSGRGLGTKLSAFMAALSKRISGMGDTAAKKIKDSLPKIMEVLGYILIGAGLYLMGIIPELTEILVMSFITLLDSVAKSVEAHRPEFVDSIEKILSTFVGIAGDLLGDLFSAKTWKNMTGWEGVLSVILILLTAIKSVASGIKLAETFGLITTAAGAGGAGGSTFLAQLLKLAPSAAGLAGLFALILAGRGANNSAVEGVEADAFEGAAEGAQGAAEAINNLQTKLQELKNQRTEMEASELGYDFSLDDEISYTTQALAKAKKDLADSLGISTDEFMAQLRAADGDATQIQAVKDAMKEYNNAVSESIGNEEALNEKFASRKQATDELVISTDKVSTASDAMWSKMISQAQNGELSVGQFKSTFQNMLSLEGIDLGGMLDGLDWNGLYNDFINGAQGIGEGVALGIGNGSEAASTAATDMANSTFLSWLAANMINSPSALYSAEAVGIPEGIAEGVTNGTYLASDAVKAMASTALTAASTYFSQNGPAAGANAVSGIIIGVNNNIWNIYNAGVAAGEAFMAGYDAATDTNSPSREMMKRGAYAIQGLMLGLQNSEDDVYGISSGIGYEVVGILQSAMAQIAVMASDKFEFNPVIAPVVDMTNVEAAAKSVNGAFGAGRIGLSGEITSSVGRRIEQAERVASNMETVNQTVNNGDSFTFNIYANDNMDEEAIADAVMNRMQTKLVRRGAAFG